MNTHKIYTFEHKGYLLQQSSYNWHYMIFDLSTDKLLCHCQHSKKLDQKEAEKEIDFFADFVNNGDNFIKDVEH